MTRMTRAFKTSVSNFSVSKFLLVTDGTIDFYWRDPLFFTDGRVIDAGFTRVTRVIFLTDWEGDRTRMGAS